VYAFNIELFLTQLAELDSSSSISNSSGVSSSSTNSGSSSSGSSVATELESRLYKAVRKALLVQVRKRFRFRIC
jgi:Secretin N-terminal domain